MNCCDQNAPAGGCHQGRDCPVRCAATVAPIKSTRPKWLDGKGTAVPPEAGNFQIEYLGPDEFLALVRTLLSWLLAVLASVGLLALAVSYSTEVHSGALWNFLKGLS